MKTIILFIITLSYVQLHGQNLIERTLEGLTCESTENPNRLYQRLGHLKNGSSVNLFRYKESHLKSSDNLIEYDVNRTALKTLENPEVLNTEVTLPMSQESSVSLLLERTSIFTNEAKLTESQAGSKTMSDIHTFRGVINGDHGSMASLTIVKGEIHLSLIDRDGHYRIFLTDEEEEKYALGLDQGLQEIPYGCDNSGDMKIGDFSAQQNLRFEKDAGDIIEVYVECDYQMFLDKGSVSAVEAYVATLFNEVSTLYANESISLQVSDIFVWTSADPYRSMSLSNVYAILQEFGSNTQNSYDGRLASLIIGRVPSGNGAGGIAWVDVLCSGYIPSYLAGPYNVNYGFGRFSINSVPNYSVDVFIMAHELGHNVASPHTHSCCWGPGGNKAIDNCATRRNCATGAVQSCALVQNPTPPQELGTIMSYCSSIDFTKGFGTEPGDLMRGRVAAANCLIPGGGGAPDCTQTNLSYSNETVPNNTEEYVNNMITLNNVVQVASNANVMWQVENELVINGEFTIPANCNVEIITSECN